jgi:hypothetical protein
MSDFVAGNTGAKLRVQCLDVDTAEPIVLSGAAVDVRWRIAGRPAVTRSMTIVDQVEGLAEYEFDSGELVCGQLKADVVLTLPNGTLTCIDSVVADVRAPV